MMKLNFYLSPRKPELRSLNNLVTISLSIRQIHKQFMFLLFSLLKHHLLHLRLILLILFIVVVMFIVVKAIEVVAVAIMGFPLHQSKCDISIIVRVATFTSLGSTTILYAAPSNSPPLIPANPSPH